MIRKKVNIIYFLLIIICCLFVFNQNTIGDKQNKLSKESQECISCHEDVRLQPAQIKEWEKSAHAAQGIGCYECHKAKKGEADAYEHNDFYISTIVSPKDCSQCHQKEYQEFTDSHHAKAGEILGSLDNFLGEAVEGQGASVQGCQYCHGSIVKVNDDGELDSKTWPNLGIGRLNPDGSKGSCSACHGKHAFSLKVARSPEACGKCHMGPDHPQKEIYDESKHGIIYYAHKDEMNLDKKDWELGKDYTQAPNCVTCHMGATENHKTTHDMGGRLSWNLRAKVSKKMKDSDKKRDEMKNVCMNCHGPGWYENFYDQLDDTVELYNEQFGKPAAEIMKRLKEKKAISSTPFDDKIEWIYFEIWHHEGRRLRHGAAMMGPDYVQWHGFYEIAKHFYFQFLPEAEKLGVKDYVKKLLQKPEHSWIKGKTPDSMNIQEAEFKQWRKKSKK
jgi:hypothetical protein